MIATYPRRQQLRHSMRGVGRATTAAVTVGGAVLAAEARMAAVAAGLGLMSAAFALASRHSRRLARRCRIGAEAERQVRGALEPLVAAGWDVEHGVAWPGRGDLDHVVLAPRGESFVIETKARRYTRSHLRRTRASAPWLARRWRRCRRGVVPVLCITQLRAVERVEDGVLVVSLDRLGPPLIAHTS